MISVGDRVYVRGGWAEVITVTEPSMRQRGMIFVKWDVIELTAWVYRSEIENVVRA